MLHILKKKFKWHENDSSQYQMDLSISSLSAKDWQDNNTNPQGEVKLARKILLPPLKICSKST